MVNRRPQLELPIGDRRDRRSASTTPEEAAAVVAGLERFMRDTAPPPAPVAQVGDAWARAAMLEGVGHEDDQPTAWGDPLRWG
jgi:hypothetical protein